MNKNRTVNVTLKIIKKCIYVKILLSDLLS